MKDVFLKGVTIYLRPLRESDLTPAYREWFNDADVTRYNSHHRFPNHDEDMRVYFASTLSSKKNLILGIFSNTDEHVGNISLQHIDSVDRSAEFAIVIGMKTYWGKGIGKEAARLIIQHGLSELNLHRIYCGTAEDNTAMQKLASSLGFREEGRSREALWKGGRYKDIINYGLLKHEWKDA